MKKVFLILLLGILFISLVSATNISIQYGKNRSDGGIIPVALDEEGKQLINFDFGNFTGTLAQFVNITVTDTGLFTGTCINTTYSGGIAISCND